MHTIRMHRKNHTHQGEASTPQTPQCKPPACPHWSPHSRACLLVKEGLFMPVEQHVAVYCITSFHISCRHYQLLDEAEILTGQEQEAPANRRRSIRIPSRHLFRFSEITGHDQIPGFREDNAWTIDLSDHGIRFTSWQPLTLNTDIRFALEADDRAVQIEGTGRVVWCEPLENTALFHAGIVFSDRLDPALLPHHRYLHQV